MVAATGSIAKKVSAVMFASVADMSVAVSGVKSGRSIEVEVCALWLVASRSTVMSVTICATSILVLVGSGVILTSSPLFFASS